MDPWAPEEVGKRLASARSQAGLTQEEVAKAVGMSRYLVNRLEGGQRQPRVDEVVHLAGALNTSLEWIMLGCGAPVNELKGVAVELYRLGIQDMHVAGAQVPGAFRHREEVVAIALKGDRPEPRVVEAMPFVLARNSLEVSLLLAFAECHDWRLKGRLAWLGEITLTLSRLNGFRAGLVSEAGLEELVRSAKKCVQPDSLGHPGDGPYHPIWARWNITYAGDLGGFMGRTKEVEAAYHLDYGLPGGW